MRRVLHVPHAPATSNTATTPHGPLARAHSTPSLPTSTGTAVSTAPPRAPPALLPITQSAAAVANHPAPACATPPPRTGAVTPNASRCGAPASNIVATTVVVAAAPERLQQQSVLRDGQPVADVQPLHRRRCSPPPPPLLALAAGSSPDPFASTLRPSDDAAHGAGNASPEPEGCLDALVSFLPPLCGTTGVAHADEVAFYGGPAPALDVLDASDTEAVEVAVTGAASVGPEELDGSWTLNQLVVLHAIGRGAQGEVHLAFDTAAGELRAVKSIPRPAAMRPLAACRLSLPASPVDANPVLTWRSPKAADFRRLRRLPAPSDCVAAAGSGIAAVRRNRQPPSHLSLRQQRLDAEIAALRRCRHRSVVRLHEVIDDPECDSVHLVMQYVERGPLAALDATGAVDRAVPLAELAGYAAQLAAGLAYLHRKGVVHRDIKPDNVLLGDGGRVYLADFGVAALTAEPGAAGGGEDAAEHAPAGTLVFRAPEVLRGEAAGVAALKAADVWALGVTLYALTYGRLPWRVGPDVPRMAVLEQILDARVAFPEIAPTSAASSPFAVGLKRSSFLTPSFSSGSFTMATTPQSEHCPRATPACEDPAGWIALLGRMLDADPAKRPSAAQAATEFVAMSPEYASDSDAGLFDSLAASPWSSLSGCSRRASLDSHDPLALSLSPAAAGETARPEEAP